ncbi:MAG: hypothetical protein P1U34_01255 [Coxiellaceae bacterium]|nr:hypothetical protein [Coxiellaceae bacterium]
MKIRTGAMVAAVAFSVIVLSGCTRQNVGIGVGAGAGALVGSAISGGSGVGIAVGAIGGALAGNAIAKDTGSQN